MLGKLKDKFLIPLTKTYSGLNKVCNRGDCSKKQEFFTAFKNKNACLFLVKNYICRRKPVSYTHLDVYKRQLLKVS